MITDLPYDAAAEESVVGALLLAPSALREVLEVLESSDFYLEGLALLFETIVDIASAGDPLDPIILADTLDQAGILDRVGGRQRIAELVCNVTATSNVLHHARIVRRLAIERAERSVGHQLTSRELDGPGAIALLEELHAGPGSASPDAWTPVDLKGHEAATTSLPSVFGLFYSGREHLLSGAPEAGKTWIALAAAAEEIRAGRRVLLLDFESGPDDILDRLTALNLTEEEIQNGIDVLMPTDPVESPRRVRGLVKRQAPSLVIVDSYTPALELHGCDPDRSKDIERFGRLVLDPLRSTGAALVVIDHLPKHPGKSSRYSIGSERKLARADVHLRVTPVRPLRRGGVAELRIATLKDRRGWLARPEAGVVRIRGNSLGQLAIELDGARAHTEATAPTKVMERVEAFLAAKERAVPRSVVEEGVIGNTAEKRRAMDELVAAGRVVETPGARNARLVELAHRRPVVRSEDSDQTSPTGHATRLGCSTDLDHSSTNGSTGDVDHTRPSPDGEGVVEEALGAPFDGRTVER